MNTTPMFHVIRFLALTLKMMFDLVSHSVKREYFVNISLLRHQIPITDWI